MKRSRSEVAQTSRGHGRRWVITATDYDDEIEKFSVATSLITEAGIIALLQRLASRHLTTGEVLHASMKKTKIAYMELLEPTKKNKPRRTISVGVGSCPKYVAAIFEDHEGGIV